MAMKIKAFFSNIKEFLLCFLRGNCQYSIKKLLAFFFTGLVFYLAIFTDKNCVEFLVFLAALLGLREYSKYNYNKNQQNVDADKG